jgi:hypothetical protein
MIPNNQPPRHFNQQSMHVVDNYKFFNFYQIPTNEDENKENIYDDVNMMENSTNLGFISGGREFGRNITNIINQERKELSLINQNIKPDLNQNQVV